MADVQQKLSDGLRVAAVSQEFDAERYEDILKAYSMMSPDQPLSVGKELLNHVTKCIEIVSKQCMLAFAANSGSHSPAEYHSKAQISDICRDMDPTQFVACTAQLYEHLSDFLYRHQFLCQWHVCRQAAPDQGEDERFRQVLREVLSELQGSKRNVWERCMQEVQLVLMTLNFQYPALTEDSFLHILHLTHLLIDEGDLFMAGSTSGQGGVPEGRRAYSGIRNTLRSKAHDYFQSLHYHTWVEFKVHHLEQDGWQRVVVPRSYRLIRPIPPAALPRREAGPATGEPSLQKLRTAENNPFRNYKPEPLLPASADASEDTVGFGKGEAGDEFDEHALLQHWIDDNENVLLKQIGSSMLSNSNRSPVVSSSTVELARVLERYFRMMGAIPQLALDIFESAGQVIEFYVHCILCLFVQDRHLRMLLDDLETPIQPGLPSSEQKLQSRHETFILQRLCPDLRRAILRTRDLMSSIKLPESCAAALGAQAPVSGDSLLKVRTSPNLSSPSSLCGLAERCVGVESVCALLNDLRDLREWLTTLVPKGAAQEEVERFLPQQEVIASQLRMFVLMSAARDVLEVPDVGRISLEHFSNTVQGLKWDVKDFSQGSPAQPYLEQMRAQIDELARRIPCAGGGSIPHATQRTVWSWMQVRIIQECVEVIAKIGKKKSQEALFRLAEDFKTLRDMSVQQNFKVAGSEEEQSLLPEGHPLAETVDWVYLDKYLEAHGFVTTNEAVIWCKKNPQYPLRLLKALVEYLPSNPKVQKQMLLDLEAYFMQYIADECVGAGLAPEGLDGGVSARLRATPVKA